MDRRAAIVSQKPQIDIFIISDNLYIGISQHGREPVLYSNSEKHEMLYLNAETARIILTLKSVRDLPWLRELMTLYGASLISGGRYVPPGCIEIQLCFSDVPIIGEYCNRVTRACEFCHILRSAGVDVQGVHSTAVKDSPECDWFSIDLDNDNMKPKKLTRQDIENL